MVKYNIRELNLISINNLCRTSLEKTESKGDQMIKLQYCDIIKIFSNILQNIKVNLKKYFN